MLRNNLDDLDANGSRGDWCFLNGDKLIAVRYGDSAFQGTVILPIAADIMDGKPHWKWDGNREAPTLSPSILVHGNPGWSAEWHGFLENGVLRDA
jgi:hypothetical protein